MQLTQELQKSKEDFTIRVGEGLPEVSEETITNALGALNSNLYSHIHLTDDEYEVTLLKDIEGDLHIHISFLVEYTTKLNKGIYKGFQSFYNSFYHSGIKKLYTTVKQSDRGLWLSSLGFSYLETRKYNYEDGLILDVYKMDIE